MSIDYIKLQKHLTAADDLIKQTIPSMSGYYLQSYQHAEENTEKNTLQHKVCQLCSTPFQPCNTKVRILSKKRRKNLNLALNVHSSSRVILLTCELCSHRNVVECSKPIVDKSKSAKKKIVPVTNSSLNEASKDETHNKSTSFIKDNKSTSFIKEKLGKSINSPILESTPSNKKRKRKSFLTPVQDKKTKESPSLLSFLSSL